MSLTAPAASADLAASDPRLHRIVAAGGLRYWIITSWALAVGVQTTWTWGLGWWALTMGLGLVRAWADRRLRPADIGRLIVATVSCAAWAIAPLLTWFGGDRLGDAVAVGLLCSGYTLVFTQMRSAPRQALIVSAPYSITTLVILVDLAGTRNFLALVTLVPVIGLALFIKTTITQMRDREMRLAAARQAELITQLESALEQAGAAARTKASFLGVVSHELRTPLNGVLGAVQLLEREALPPRAGEFVQVIARSGASLRDLLNDVLDLTKIEAGHMTLDMVDIRLDDLAGRLVGPFEAQAAARGLAMEIVRANPLPERVTTDPLRLGQIVQNFLSNAIKFSERGSIRLILSAEPAAEHGRVRLRITVEDQGVGIAAEDVDRLFQPFSQVDDSSTRRFGGTGLGLNIARRLAELFGGRVGVRSTPGEGSTFWVEVEMAASFAIETEASENGSEAADATAVPSTGDRLHVLAVDDQPANRFVLKALLEPLGHIIVEAADGAAAVETAALQAFDLILMDVQMPVMDGLSALRAIRARGPSQATPVLVLSASDSDDDRTQALAAGADGFLSKPLQFSEVLAALKTIRRQGDPEASGRIAAI